MAFSLLLRRRTSKIPPFLVLFPRFSSSTAAEPSPSPPPLPSKPSSLSARLSFVFDQLDAIERDRDRAAKHEALHRIRSWHQDHRPPAPPPAGPLLPPPAPAPAEATEAVAAGRKEVELVHPWPEWIELMERLAQQNYFHTRARGTDEDQVAASAGIDLSGIIEDQTGFDFSRDWITVRNACTNFGRDRFDILRSLSRKDLQVLVGHGCPSMDSKVVFSAKLLRKHVHLDEGDVCSSCSLRNSCGRGYILTRKEDEARTLDVMRVLLTFGFDHVNGTVENKPLMKMRSVKTVVRKLLHEVVKLSAVPIDPNLPPPVIKKPPPKVKQPPPPPKKRVGRDDVEMKKGDWLCPKCDFMNFAKNTVCLQCDAKRPKRQLLPGEWECPQCNFLNYRRNMVCFHCEHKRPPDEFMENQIQAKQSGRRMRLEGDSRLSGISDSWNFDFDDNESDGADVAAFEFADPPKGGQDTSLDVPRGGIAAGFEDDIIGDRRSTRAREGGRYISEVDDRMRDTSHSPRTGFDDFDDEDDIDSYEIASNNNSTHEVSRRSFSDFENSGSEGFDDIVVRSSESTGGTKNYLSASEDDGHYEESDNDLREHSNWQSSHTSHSSQKARKAGHNERHGRMPSASADDAEIILESDEDLDAVFKSNKRKIGQRIPHRDVVRLGGNSDTDDELFFDSESDGENLRPRGIKMKGNGDVSKRRSSSFRNHNQVDVSRSREFRRDDRERRKSFDRENDELSFKGSRGYDRGSFRDHYGGFRGNNRLHAFDRKQLGRNDRFRDRLEHSRGGYRGSHGDNYRGLRGDNRPSNREGRDFRQRGRRNQYTD